MARRRHEPEEIVAKLRQAEVLAAQGKSIAVTETTYFRCRAEYRRDEDRPGQGGEGEGLAPVVR